MENILAFDTNLIFPKTKVVTDLSGASTPAEIIAKIQNDLLLKGCISMFCPNSTMILQAVHKSTKYIN